MRVASGSKLKPGSQAVSTPMRSISARVATGSGSLIARRNSAPSLSPETVRKAPARKASSASAAVYVIDLENRRHERVA